MKKRSKFSWLA